MAVDYTIRISTDLRLIEFSQRFETVGRVGMTWLSGIPVDVSGSERQ